MIINYSDQPVNKTYNSIFLAGPTPRDKSVESWRVEAIQILKDIGFDGVVYVPELENDDRTFDYDNQVEWEWKALNNAGIILFWIPRDLEKLPGYTTNVEFGYYFGSFPNRVVYGRPDNAEKIKYLDWLYSKKSIRKVHNNLEDAIRSAVKLLSSRRGLL